MEAGCGAVWIPFHTCSNQTEVAEAVPSFVMTLKELTESILSHLWSRSDCIDSVCTSHNV